MEENVEFNSTLRMIVLLGTPLFALTFLLLFHPSPYDDVADELMPIAGWWIALHTIVFGLVPFMGVALWLLTAGLEGVVATLSRVAAVVFALFYDAGDAIAGISTGILARSAEVGALGERIAVGAIDTLFADPFKSLLFDIRQIRVDRGAGDGSRRALAGWSASLASGLNGATGVPGHPRPRISVRKPHLRDLLCARSLARTHVRKAHYS